MTRALAMGVLLALAACMESQARLADSVSTETISLRHRAEALSESLRVARGMSERQSQEKDLLVREVHSFDYFMVQLQDEFRQIRSLEQEAGTLDPRQDPLAAMESERSRILDAAKAARLRLARLERAAERQGKQLAALRESVRASADSALNAGSELDSNRVALASVRLLVQDLRTRIDELQLQVDSLTAYARTLTEENQRLTAVIAADAARDSTVYVAVGTRRQLLDWRLAREVGGVPVTGWGRTLQSSDLRDTVHFTPSHMRSRVIKLDETRDYQLLTSQSTSALDNHLTPDGSFRGSLRIRDPEAFWRAGKWVVILAR